MKTEAKFKDKKTLFNDSDQIYQKFIKDSAP